jgi:hypothetical protein
VVDHVEAHSPWMGFSILKNQKSRKSTDSVSIDFFSVFATIHLLKPPATPGKVFAGFIMYDPATCHYPY